MRRATLSARDNAVECSSLKSGSTFSSQFDRRTSRIGMPACSDSVAASRSSKYCSVTTRVSTKLGTTADRADQAVRLPGGRQHEALALVGAGFERLGPDDALARAGDDVDTDDHGAGLEVQRLAGSAQEQLGLRAVAGPDQALQRLPRGQHPRRREGVFAQAAQFLAGCDARVAHLRNRLLLGLLAQQADGAEGKREDRGQHEAAQRQRQGALERGRPRDQSPQAGHPLAQLCRNPVHQPVRRSARHSTNVLITSVTIASRASMDATANADTNRYSL